MLIIIFLYYHADINIISKELLKGSHFDKNKNINYRTHQKNPRKLNIVVNKNQGQVYLQQTELISIKDKI